MIATGETTGSGHALVGNGWYFDGYEWHSLALPVQEAGGTWVDVKWDRAYLSKDGYTLYLTTDGTGYVWKVSYN
jgi:hypothetical protein